MDKDNLIIEEIDINDEPVIIEVDSEAKNGQNKCPKCGATDISQNIKTGKLRCNYCRHEFDGDKINGEDDVTKLEGVVIGSGAQNMEADAEDIVTLKCTSCGAEVVIDTNETAHARCHWCRNSLSINEQLPNGAIPDMILPFAISKEEAKDKINEFVKKRKFFAHPKFKKEFTTENIMGVYFPYMVVDVNGSSKLNGQGEKLVRKYTRGSGDSRRTYYDADLYNINREFDLCVDDLTVEANSDRLDNTSNSKTNNIINSVMPFDTENCVKWDANFLKGYTSERRDTNIDSLRSVVSNQAKDIARFKANETLNAYDRGVRWDSEELNIKGEKWKASYLPVWLYSYQQKKGKKSLLHYVAVNARTKETMGSVPINMMKLLLFAFIIELFSIYAGLTLEIDNAVFYLAPGVVYYFIFYAKYRNSNARHKHEAETRSQMLNVKGSDAFVSHLKGLSNSKIKGVNNDTFSNQSKTTKILDSVSEYAKIMKK